MKRTIVALTLMLAVGLLGCGGEDSGTEAGKEGSGETPAAEKKDLLLDPSAPEVNHTAPETFKVSLDTSRGEIVIEVRRAWSPNGADRFYNLVTNGYYDDCRFFRVMANFMAQIGMHGDPRINAVWSEANIPDDPVVESNKRGMVTFAKRRAPNSRSTQIFINYKDNSGLDDDGFSPFGKVVKGMDVVDALYSGYGDADEGGPSQGQIRSSGNAYLNAQFPKLDYVKKARVLEE
jgi:peptidyl-prolyl cis-trans isomerase A (cyclophilin A)